MKASQLPGWVWYVGGALVVVGGWLAYLPMTVPHEECERLMRTYESSADGQVLNRLEAECPAWEAMR